MVCQASRNLKGPVQQRPLRCSSGCQFLCGPLDVRAVYFSVPPVEFKYNQSLNRKHKAKHGECAYCGEWREITRDHIVSRSLFSKPRPGHLITVAWCYPCNKEASE